MTFLGWMMDIAREQSPSETWLDEVLTRSRDVGYDAVGLYLEHRFAYPSAPWAAGEGAVTPDVVRRLGQRHRSRGLRVIPFINTLGHMEGFIRAEGGQYLAEGPTVWGTEQMCPTRPECRAFALRLISDIIDTFDDDWIHLGGDEARQLGQCPACAQRVASDGVEGLYGEYYGMLCRAVLDRGRRPCIWGDMLLHHPAASAALPRDTLVFDWKYDGSPIDTTPRLQALGFEVVCCPYVQPYPYGWWPLAHTLQNVDDHVAVARSTGAVGVLISTWEACYFNAYRPAMPLVYAAAARARDGTSWRDAIDAQGGTGTYAVLELIGGELPQRSGLTRPGTWPLIRDALVMRLDPFQLWRVWRDAGCGAAGDDVLRACEAAEAIAPPDSPLRFAVLLHRVAVGFVRQAEEASRAWARGELSRCTHALRQCDAELARLSDGVHETADRGGSRADVARLTRMRSWIRQVEARVALFSGASPAAYRPAFAVLTHPQWEQHDQAAWRTTLAR